MHPTRTHTDPSSTVPLMSRLLLKARAGLAWPRAMLESDGTEAAGVRVATPS